MTEPDIPLDSIAEAALSQITTIGGAFVAALLIVLALAAPAVLT